jgi:hypothetical protein
MPVLKGKKFRRKLEKKSGFSLCLSIFKYDWVLVAA